jgi:hypothetical protein
MVCRLYIDEVGNDDVGHPRERYLSLTGLITKVEFHERRFKPEIEKLKSDLFGHNPPATTVILHRREIMRKEAPFECLRNEDKNAEWEKRLIDILDKLPFLITTVMIDKHSHRDRYAVWLFNPYHYCMRNLVERYVLWLNRHKLTGDVVAEPRFKKVDKALKKSFGYIYKHGTENIPEHIVQRCLTSQELKFEPKAANVAGLQIVDLIAHPSHHGTRAKFTGDPMTASFGAQIYALLEKKKYSRNPKNLVVSGWGQKWLP